MDDDESETFDADLYEEAVNKVKPTFRWLDSSEWGDEDFSIVRGGMLPKKLIVW